MNPRPPFVSVIIAARNEAGNILGCIESVYVCGHPRDRLEIIVVDHASTDATSARARGAGASVIELHTGRIGKVRNTGLEVANGEYIAYVDADCIVPSTWLGSAIHCLAQNAAVGAVGGPYLSPIGGTWVEVGLAPQQCDSTVMKPVTALATGSFITRRSLLMELGGFDESLISGEDDDLCNRIRDRGFAILSLSDCHVVHRGYPRSFWRLVQKEIWHGSNHLDVRSAFDITLILTIVFVLALVGTGILASVALLEPSAAVARAVGLSVLLQSLPPALYAAKRVRQRPQDWYRTPGFLVVGYAYFLGHGLGVLNNLLRRLRCRST